MRHLLTLLVLTSLLTTSCRQLVRYTDALIDPSTGRTVVVRTPAAFGGVIGFVAGVPVDIVALPIAWFVYSSQEEETRDPTTTFLFPSIALERVSRLIAMPLDILEFIAYRVWLPEDTLTRDERERLERVYDDNALPSYPVETLFGDPPGRR